MPRTTCSASLVIVTTLITTAIACGIVADAAAMYRAMRAQKGKEGLAGLGDVSCWYDEKHEELQVLKDTIFFSIELRGLKNPTNAIKAVAKKVFDRLK